MSKRSASSRTDSRSGRFDTAGNWFLVLSRAVAVLVVSLPAVLKFVQYAEWVAKFDGWGLLWPEVAVPVVGALQIAAALSLLFGIAGRAGAGVLAVVMIGAMSTAGPDPMNAVVLGSSMVIAVFGTGPFSRWDPEFSDLSGTIGNALRGTGPSLRHSD